MAHKAESFKVNDEKQTIIIYSNVEVPAGEKFLIDRYLDKGYTPLFEEKKKSKTVPEMRKELKAKDKEAYEEFERIYNTKVSKNASKKEKSEAGFFGACRYYAEWAKKNGKK